MSPLRCAARTAWLSTAFLLLQSVSPGAVEAQIWDTRFTVPYLDGAIYDFATFRNELIATGAFTRCGTEALDGLAKWNGTSWEAFPADFNGEVKRLAVAGDWLYAVGDFEQPWGTRIMRHVARWDGTDWSRLQGGLSSTPQDVSTAGSTLYVGGSFEDISGHLAPVAVWNGTSWTYLNGGVNLTWSASAVASDGVNIYAATGSSVRKWVGPNWVQVGSVLPYPAVDLAVFDGAPLACGRFDDVVVRWNGTAWVKMGGQYDGDGAFFAQMDGALYVAARLKYSTPVARDESGVHVWNGADWERIGESLAVSGLGTLGMLDGRLLVAGTINQMVPAGVLHYTAALDGGHWVQLEPWLPGMMGLDGPVYALAAQGSSLYVGGAFSIAGGVKVSNIARWDGVSWHPLGTGVNGNVQALMYRDGALVAGGKFTTAGGIPVDYLATWDGTSWSPFADGVASPLTSPACVYSLEESAGSLFVGASVDYLSAGYPPCVVARWDGAMWTTYGSDLYGAPYSTLHHNGDFYAGGWLFHTEIGSEVGLARWTGAAWNQVGRFLICCRDDPFGPLQAPGSIKTLLAWNGRLYAAGAFNGVDTSPVSFDCGHVAYLEGGVWHDMVGVDDPGLHPEMFDITLRRTLVNALVVHDGSLYATGSFLYAGPGTANGLARWDGTAWNTYSTGIQGGEGAVLLSDGPRLWVGGSFRSVGGILASNLACYGDASVPVRITDTAARWVGDDAEISWSVTDELGEATGFDVCREAADGAKARLTEAPLRGRVFTFIDPDAPSDGAKYWIEEHGRTGESTWYGPITLAPREQILRLALSQNSPNPFTSSTTLRFALPTAAPARVRILDIAGRLVAEPLQATLPAGEHTVVWDGRTHRGDDAAPGVYLCVLDTGNGRLSRRMLLTR